MTHTQKRAKALYLAAIWRGRCGRRRSVRIAKKLADHGYRVRVRWVDDGVWQVQPIAC